MASAQKGRRARARRNSTGTPVLILSLATLSVAFAACASSSSTSSGGGSPSPSGAAMSMMAPSPDPRVGLRAGLWDAASAIWNLKLVSTTRPPQGFVGVTNSDLAFTGKYVIQGNYNGYQVWDISNPGKPALTKAFLCPALQSDVSVFKDKLLFVSGEGTSGRLDCGAEGVQDTVSHDRLRGIRIFDITDIRNPKNVANVQTCRGSHTHTVVVDPNDAENVYVYVSGSAPVRSPSELPGCSGAAPDEDPNSALFRIEVIKVPLAHPEQSAIVSSPHIFDNLAAPPRASSRDSMDARERAAAAAARGGGAGRGGAGRGGAGRAGGGPPRAPTGPNQCHDITVYPAIGLAGGACGGYGLLLDIHDAAHPRRISAAADSNFSFWHSATFSNDGSKVLFTDEWGGGSAPRCRTTDKMEWGADAIFTINGSDMTFRSYYKMPAPQTSFENCVAHNGSLIPIPGRDVMVQGWYQGGISVFDWTDASHPREIGYFDRGPNDSTRLMTGGSWSAYWYNGHIYSSEIQRGLDVFDLVPSGNLSQNEIDAAKTVTYTYFNTQDQPKIVWPPSFALARAYLDQLERSNGLGADRIAAARTALAGAEKASGAARQTALSQLSTQLHADAPRAQDQAKVHTLATAVGDLANAH